MPQALARRPKPLPKPIKGCLFKRAGADGRYLKASSPEVAPYWFEFRLPGGGEDSIRRFALKTTDHTEAVMRANALIWKATQFAEEAYLQGKLTPGLEKARREERNAVPRSFDNPRSVTVANVLEKRIPLSGLWDAVKGRYDARFKSQEVYRQQTAKFVKYATEHDLEYAEDVTRDFSEGYARWIYERVTTAPKHIGCLRRVWQLLYPDATSNPWDLGIRLQPKEKESAMNYRTLTLNEVRRVRQVVLRLAGDAELRTGRFKDFSPELFSEMADAILFSYHYGLRIGSIAAIRQSDFNVQHGTWVHRPPKTSRATLGTDYPILPEIAPILRLRLSGDKDAPLFPAFAQAYRTAEQKLNLANKAIFKLAEVEDSRIKGRATWHSFRATFITRLTEAGCPVSIVKELAQHTKGDVTQRYVHISMENKLRWLSAIPELGEVDMEAEYPTEPELPQAAGADAAS